MMEIRPLKIAVIGGDDRAPEAARVLMERGAVCTFYALEQAGVCRSADALRCEEPYLLFEALSNADAVLLPLPVSRDGQTVFSPLSAVRLPLPDLAAALPQNCLVAGGRIPPILLERSSRSLDLLSDPAFSAANALPTAESAIALALLRHPGVLASSRCAVLGFGNIGSILAQKLSALGADVTVFARRPESRLAASSFSLSAFDFDALPALLPSFDLLFNTVPAPIIDLPAALSVSPDALYLELASPPFGLTPAARRALRCPCLDAPGLPGRYSPRFAGALIADCLLSSLYQKE